jgi:hypothetical protein
VSPLMRPRPLTARNSRVRFRPSCILPAWFIDVVQKRRLRCAVAPHLYVEALETRTLLSAAIFGAVWNDLNADGVRQATEPTLPGVQVYLDQNHDGKFSSRTVDALPATLTLGAGPNGAAGKVSTVSLTGLDARVTSVKVHLDASNTSSGPIEVDLISPRFDNVNVVAGSILMYLPAGASFSGTFDQDAATPINLGTSPYSGNFRPELAFTSPLAHVYEGDSNGAWGLMFQGDLSGLSLHSWSLTFTEPEPNAETDANGNYSFTGLAPGSYTAGVVLPQAAVPTLPQRGSSLAPVAVSGDDIIRGVDLGFQPGPDLVGVSFHIAETAPNWGDVLTVNYSLVNQGGRDAAAFVADLRLLSSTAPGGSSVLLQTLRFDHGLPRGSSVSGSLKVQLPGSPAQPPPGFRQPYEALLALVIDPDNVIAESDETNNRNVGLGVDLATLQQLPNEAVTDDAGVQQMPSITVDPHDPDHLVVAYMDYSLLTSGYAGIGVSVSHDGGATWQRGSVPLAPGFDQAAGQPIAQFDDAGHVFVSFMAATFLGAAKPPIYYDLGRTNGVRNRSLAMTSNNGVFVARSDDGGTTWNPPVAVAADLYAGQKVFLEALPDLAVDNVTTLPNGQANPNHGNLYVTWTRFYPKGTFPGQSTAPAGSDVMFSVSHDGGQTWQTQLQDEGGLQVSAIKDPLFGDLAAGSEGSGFSGPSHLAVGPAGDIYLSMYSGGFFTVFHSATGGSSFVPPNPDLTHGYPFGGLVAIPASTLFGDSFRTLYVRDIVADPVRPGHVFVVEAIEVKNQDGTPIDAAELYFARSDDYGVTWQTIFTVGSNPLNLGEIPTPLQSSYLSAVNDDDGGRFLGFSTQLQNEVVSGQALPRMSIDSQGNLAVIWYDTRRDPAGQKLDVVGTVSTDGGQHFSANYRISDTTFDPNAGVFTDAIGNPINYYMGDLIGLATANGVGFAAWTDTRAGNQNIQFARYSLVPPPVPLGDRFEPNDTPPTATDLGPVFAQRELPRLTVGAGDEDWYRVQTTAKGDLIVSASNPAGGTSLQVEIRDATGSTLLATGTALLDATGLVLGQQAVFATDSGQTYLIHILGSSTATADYSLSIQSLTANLGSQVFGVQAGTLTEGGTAVYRLAAAVPGSLAIQLTAGPIASSDSTIRPNLTLRVLSADGLTVLASGVLQPPGVMGPGEVAEISLPVKQGQVVLLQIVADPATSGPYQLEFTNLDQFETSDLSSLFFPLSGAPSAVVLEDLNADGRPDLVVSSNKFADEVSVLLDNGDGTFQAAREYPIGAGQDSRFVREIAVADMNGDHIPDIVVSNHNSSDVSVLLGHGDGTFAPERRSDATAQPSSLAVADFNGDGIPDIVALDTLNHEPAPATLGVMLGRGDGTYAPAIRIGVPFQTFTFPVRVGDFNRDGKLDLAAFGINEAKFEVFFGNEDGTFAPGGIFASGEVSDDAQVADLDHDGKLDFVVTGANTGNIYVILGNGDGTFQKPQAVTAAQPRPGDNIAIVGVAIADLGTPQTQPDGSVAFGSPDGKLDLVVTAKSRVSGDPAQVIVLPGVFATDSNGDFVLFGAPQRLAFVQDAGKIAIGDVNGDGVPDVAVNDIGGVRVLYGKTPHIVPNSTPAAARNLGTVVHLVNPIQAIVPGHEDAYFTLTVPNEAAAGAGDEVLDVSALFQDVSGAGLGLEVRDAAGNVLGTGARLRLPVAQGVTLSVHVFGVAGTDGSRGAGAYALDIDVLPQVVSVEGQSLLPGTNGQSGGRITTLVVTFQGDRLDPAAAADPANYTVIHLADDAPTDPSRGQIVPLATSNGSPAVLYNPGANTEVSSGRTFPTAVRQTVTLVFDQPLPVGSYEIDISPKIQAGVFDVSESALLAGGPSFTGHPVVSVVNGVVVEGGRQRALELIKPATSLGDLNAFAQGTPFLTQLHSDLGALLDALLTSKGDDPAITALMNQEILQRLLPGLGSVSERPTSVAVIWLDPVSIDVEAPQGNRVAFNRQKGELKSAVAKTFVEVGENVEILVLADVVGTFHLNVADVSDSARGGALVFGLDGFDQVLAFTDGLRNGDESFSFVVPGRPDIGDQGTSHPGHHLVAPPPTVTGPNTGVSQAAVAALVTLLSGPPAGVEATTAAEVSHDAASPANAPASDAGNSVAALVSAGDADTGVVTDGKMIAVDEVLRQFWPAVAANVQGFENVLADVGWAVSSPLASGLDAASQALTSAGLPPPGVRWREFFGDLAQTWSAAFGSAAGEALRWTRRAEKSPIVPVSSTPESREGPGRDEPDEEGQLLLDDLAALRAADAPSFDADAYWATGIFATAAWSLWTRELAARKEESERKRPEMARVS